MSEGAHNVPVTGEGAPRNVLVTGGTGALGRAIVARFLAGGDRVVAPWIDSDEADALRDAHADALEAKRLVLLEADVSETQGAEQAARAAGAVDVLVNGVGGFAGGNPVLKTPLEVFDRMYRLNFRTAVATSRAVLPGMCERGRGALVNVASRAVWSRPTGLAAYAASKAAVALLTETLQKEVGEHGVRVCAVVPDTIDTPANREAMPDADRSSWTPPDAIARVVHWLASDAASAVRGGLIPV